MIPTRPFRLCYDSKAKNVSAAAIPAANAECPHGVVLRFPPPAPRGSSQVPSGSRAQGPLPPGRCGPAASPAPPSRCSRRSPGGNERLAALSGGAAAARGRARAPPSPSGRSPQPQPSPSGCREPPRGQHRPAPPRQRRQAQAPSHRPAPGRRCLAQCARLGRRCAAPRG